MEVLAQRLKEKIDNMSEEELERKWNELDHYNDNCPTIDETVGFGAASRAGEENIYVFICAKSYYNGHSFEYSGTYAISKDANWDNVIDHITEEMSECFKGCLGGINSLPRAGIVSMNEISKELYDRLHQEHNK